jgi:biopolymer transport protein ExbB/TolQ
MIQSLAEAMRLGGVWMYPILAMSVVALGIAIERIYFLYIRYNINGATFMDQITKLVMAGNIDRAIKLCNAAPTQALPRIVKAGLTRANKGEAAVGQAIEEATLEMTPLISKRTNSLLAIANVATLLGLLGTIVGLIESFASLENASPADKQRLLASGISVAMYTTAFGLIVAIPTMLVHLFLSGVTKKIMEEIDQYSVRLENLLGQYAKGKLTPE